MYAETVSFGREEWCDRCHRAWTAAQIRGKRVKCRCGTAHLSLIRDGGAWNGRLLQAAAECEVEFNRLAKCLPAIIGTASWPDPGEGDTASEDDVLRCVRTMRTFDLAFEIDEQGATALAFVYLFFGAARRESVKADVGVEAMGRAHTVWVDARDAEGRGGHAHGRVCMVRLCEGLSRIAYGNADVGEARNGWTDYHGGQKECPVSERVDGVRKVVGTVDVTRRQPLGIGGMHARPPGESWAWSGIPSPNAPKGRVQSTHHVPRANAEHAVTSPFEPRAKIFADGCRKTPNRGTSDEQFDGRDGEER